MKSFKSFVTENVASTTRESMLHLQKMNDIEFIEFIRSVKNEMEGKLKNLSVSLKVDGAGARFGKDASGRPFFEGSRTGPIFEPKTFSSFARNKGTSDTIQLARAAHYDDIFDIVVSAAFVKSLPKDSKVIVELFYNPMGEITQDGIKFVTVSYDRKKLGQIMTIVPFKVVKASNGEPHPDSDTIIKNLYKQSNDKIRFIDPALSTKGEVDISGKIDPILSLNKEMIEVLKSRKAADKQAKEDTKAIIQSVKDDVAEYILNHPNIVGKFKLGPDIEGLVLNINGKMVKVTTPEFKASKAKERADR